MSVRARLSPKGTQWWRPARLSFEGSVGEPGEQVTLELSANMEAGHYNFVEAKTSAQGESRLDRGVKNYFTRLHKMAAPRYALSASY